MGKFETMVVLGAVGVAGYLIVTNIDKIKALFDLPGQAAAGVSGAVTNVYTATAQSGEIYGSLLKALSTGNYQNATAPVQPSIPTQDWPAYVAAWNTAHGYTQDMVSTSPSKTSPLSGSGYSSTLPGGGSGVVGSIISGSALPPLKQPDAVFEKNQAERLAAPGATIINGPFGPVVRYGSNPTY